MSAYFPQVAVVSSQNFQDENLFLFTSDSISNNDPADCSLLGERLSSLVVTGALKADSTKRNLLGE